MAKKNEKKATITRGELEIKSLKVILTEEKIIIYSKKLAKANNDKVEIEAKLKAVKDDFKHQTSKADADIAMLSDRISTGEEYSDVQCFWEFNWEKGEKRLIREDTGEEVAKYEITDFERQEQLKMDGGEEAA